MDRGPAAAREAQDRSPSVPAGTLRIGTAGWTIPADAAGRLPGQGTHLERYARVLPAVEINSSFHRPHRVSTYERWAASVPDGFRFSVKLPKEITHSARLVDGEALLDDFMPGPRALGATLGCLLVQLPPSLSFEPAVVEAFFARLRERHQGGVACEPRHASWLHAEAEELLQRFQVARVAADPDRPAGAGAPGGWTGLRYHRLHGWPRMYYSSYPREYLERLAARIAAESEDDRPVWCILDNTAHGAATANALDLLQLTGGRR